MKVCRLKNSGSINQECSPLPLISKQPSLFKKSKFTKETQKCLTPRLLNKAGGFDETESELKEDLGIRQLQKVAARGVTQLNKLISRSDEIENQLDNLSEISRGDSDDFY